MDEIQSQKRNMEINGKEERVPKRVIHFSDGTVPEYSTDEDENDTAAEAQTVHIDPASLSWIDWLQFKTTTFGITALNVCDYLGDSLSSFLGITSPKYQFEIDHYNMMKQMEQDLSDTELGIVKTEESRKEKT